MPVYEYRCTSCGDQVATESRLEEVDSPSAFNHVGQWVYYELDDEYEYACGPLKRTWSVGFQIKSGDWGH